MESSHGEALCAVTGSSELDSTDSNVWTARLNKEDWTKTATAPLRRAETIDHNEDEKQREVGVYRSQGGAELAVAGYSELENIKKKKKKKRMRSRSVVLRREEEQIGGPVKSRSVVLRCEEEHIDDEEEIGGPSALVPDRCRSLL
ncbi:hypothetical protein Dsin_020905 [Dipteronia sinensis]|uniref:Uncharacterized protein n=1 Tax=Dipteronia sinensis TaxID=43782 RepID=A0AAE0AAT0_9ROSI|nr:hypothetical protein Dsin_020905 [Dipteronia sinensis]